MRNSNLFAAIAVALAMLACASAVNADSAKSSSSSAGAPSVEQRLADLELRLKRLQAANDVESLQRTYGYFVDKAMWTEISQLFTEDGTYEIGGRGIFIGPKRVLEYLQVGLGAEHPVEGRLINHMQFQPFVTVSPDGLRAKVRMRAFVMSNGGWGIPMYENEYVKQDGVWKISKLRGPFRMYTSMEGWAKSATPNTRPDSFPPPPDRLPSVVYLTYPSPYIVPFHYVHPVTGAPFKGPEPASAKAAPSARLGDVLIDDTAVYPESITAMSDGTLINGSVKGVVYRALPSQARATPWIRPTPENGLLSVLGVVADERTNTLWLCSAPMPVPGAPPAAGKVSSLMTFDLRSGKHKATYPFPAPASACNDVAIAADGTAFATDTPNGSIFKVAPGSKTLELFLQDDRLKGIDGIAFSGDGTLYVNIVSRGALVRVDRKADGSAGDPVQLTLSQPVKGPDGFRLIEGNRFLLAEGQGGRIDEVSISGNSAQIKVLRDGLNSPPGVTLVGNTAYAVEGKIGYLIDPKLKGQDPGAFKALAIPLAAPASAKP